MLRSVLLEEAPEALPSALATSASADSSANRSPQQSTPPYWFPRRRIPDNKTVLQTAQETIGSFINTTLDGDELAASLVDTAVRPLASSASTSTSGTDPELRRRSQALLQRWGV